MQIIGLNLSELRSYSEISRTTNLL